MRTTRWLLCVVIATSLAESRTAEAGVEEADAISHQTPTNSPKLSGPPPENLRRLDTSREKGIAEKVAEAHLREQAEKAIQEKTRLSGKGVGLAADAVRVMKSPTPGKEATEITIDRVIVGAIQTSAKVGSAAATLIREALRSSVAHTPDSPPTGADLEAARAEVGRQAAEAAAKAAAKAKAEAAAKAKAEAERRERVHREKTLERARRQIEQSPRRDHFRTDLEKHTV
ncbi:MAG: hypothetical protein Fues2KO_47450 [Fuerstiella sp.]